MFVGQFGIVQATASSGLPVALSTEGPCILRDLPGATHSVVVATAAGQCTVWATQDGDANWLPADRTGKEFSFMMSEVDVKVTIPGPDRIEPGNPLPVFADVTGENGDDPVPSGWVRYTVKDADGKEIEVREDAMDANGESRVEFPEASTVNWPAGVYRVYAYYRGDDGYQQAHADGVPFTIGSTTDVLSGMGGISMLVEPTRTPLAGTPAKVTLRGFPDDAHGSVTFSILNPRVSDKPIVEERSISGDSLTYSFDTGPAGHAGTILVKAAYSYYYDDLVYRDTLVQNYAVRAKLPSPITILPPNDKDPLKVIGKMTDGAHYLYFSANVPGGRVPSVTTQYPKWTILKVNGHHGDVTDYYMMFMCRMTVTLSVPEDEYYRAGTHTFTVYPALEGKTCTNSSGPEAGGRGDLIFLPPPDANAGRTIRLDDVPAANPDAAQVVDVKVGEAIHLRFPWATPLDALSVSQRVDGKWIGLGQATVDADGWVTFPTFMVKAGGDYVLRLMDDTTGYVIVHAE